VTDAELQSRVVRAVEAHYDCTVAAHRAAGMEAGEAHERAFRDAVRVLGEALEELRRRGLFPFPEGEIKPSPADGGRHA
jgi:hypothetical protein